MSEGIGGSSFSQNHQTVYLKKNNIFFWVIAERCVHDHLMGRKGQSVSGGHRLSIPHWVQSLVNPGESSEYLLLDFPIRWGEELYQVYLHSARSLVDNTYRSPCSRKLSTRSEWRWDWKSTSWGGFWRYTLSCRWRASRSQTRTGTTSSCRRCEIKTQSPTAPPWCART